MESTLIVSLTGSIELHDWARRKYADGVDDDAFILIVRQSVMQGMTAFHRSKESPRILWHHNDAGDAWTGSAETPELIWLQVDTGGTERGRVPLQPIGSVLEKVLGKVGTPEVTQGDFLLPLGEFNGQPIEFAYDRDWFAFSDPGRAESIAVELYSSTADSTRAASVVSSARTWLGDAAVLETGDGPDPGPVEFRGSSYVPLEFLGHVDCTVREWSVEVLAWLAEVLGWAMREAGCGDHGFVRLRRR